MVRPGTECSFLVGVGGLGSCGLGTGSVRCPSGSSALRFGPSEDTQGRYRRTCHSLGRCSGISPGRHWGRVVSGFVENIGAEHGQGGYSEDQEKAHGYFDHGVFVLS